MKCCGYEPDSGQGMNVEDLVEPEGLPPQNACSPWHAMFGWLNYPGA